MSSTYVEPLEEAAATTPGRKKRMAPSKRHNLTGWIFLIPAALLILITSFWPMIQAFLLSLQTGKGTRLNWAEPLWYNYARLFQDATFRLTLGNTFLYLIIQVPIMLGLALVLANLLNNPNLRWKGFWRTAIFLPCAVSLVSYSLVFRTLFSTDGFANDLLMGIGVIDSPVNCTAYSKSYAAHDCAPH